MRWKNLILIFAALAMVVVLAACSSAGQPSSDQGGAQDQGGGEQAQKAPKKMNEEAEDRQVAPAKGKGEKPGKEATKVDPPKNNTMRLTVPKMAEIKNDVIPTGRGNDDALFRDYAAVHLKFTGFPWDEEANVYIAGHRIGYPGTRSNLAFYDLEGLRNGDTFFLTDSEGRKYNYKVFNKLVVEPTDLSVLKPVKGKNIVSLQTCTLPDYADRVIYQAELQNIET